MKTFEEGAIVEIRISPSSPWTSAVYERRTRPWSRVSYHRVRVDTHYVDSMSGERTTSDNPRAYRSTIEIVPANRIRAAVSHSNGSAK